MRINQIEPRFEALEEKARVAQERCDLLEERIGQVLERLEGHENKAVCDAHLLSEGEYAVQETAPPSIVEEAAQVVVNAHEAAEEVVEKVATKVEDARFPKVNLEPEPEPEAPGIEPEMVEPLGSVEVVVSGNLDPKSKYLLEQLKQTIETDRLKVTIDEREE